MDTLQLKQPVTSTSEPPDLGAIQGIKVLFHEDETNNEAYLKEHANDIFLVFMNALKAPDTKVIQDTLVTLGQGLHSEAWVNCLSEEHCDELITELCHIIEGSKMKAISSRAIWCFSCQMFRNCTVVRHLKAILSSILKSLLESNFESSSLQYEVLRVLRRFLSTIPFELSIHNKIWWKVVSSNLVHPASRVRLTALDVLVDFHSILCQNATIMNQFVCDVKENIVPKMKLFSEMDYQYVLKLWKSIIRFFGKVLHRGSSLINCLLEVIQKTFKSSVEDVKIAAFESWQHLIDNFAIDLDAICNVKRLRLLLQPLQSHNAKTEGVIRAKVLCWWHLINALDCNIQRQYELVFEPLILFCFGNSKYKCSMPSSLASSNNMSNDSFLNITTGSLNNVECADKNGQLDLLLARFGLQVIGRLFEASFEGSPKISLSLCLNSLRYPVISGTLMLLKYKSSLLRSVEISSYMPWSESKDAALMLYIWQSLTNCVKMLADAMNENDCNQREVIQFISAYFCILERVVKEKQLNPQLIIEILEIVSSLPTTLLLSSAFSLTGSNPLNGTPSLFLLKLLFSNYLIEEAGSQKRFLQIFMRLSLFSSSTPRVLSSIQSAIEIIDKTANCLKLDLSFKFWSMLITHLIENIEQNQDVNQGDNFEHDFTCVYAVLMFPLKHFVLNDISVVMKRSVWKKWDKLYDLFARCAAFVCDINSNQWCYELGSKIFTVFKGKLQLVEFEDIRHIVDTLLKSLQWSTVRSCGTVIGKATLVNSGKNKIDEHFPLSPVIRLIIMMIDSAILNLNDLAPTKSCAVHTAELLLDLISSVLEKLKNNNLVNAVILLSANLARIFELSSTSNSVFEDSLILTKIDELWSNLTKALPVNYKGAYNSNFLKDISPLLEATLKHKRRSIRMSSRLFWQATFASSYRKLTLPVSLREVLLQIKPLIESENLSPEGATLLCSPVSKNDDFKNSNAMFNSPKVSRNVPSESLSSAKKFLSPIKTLAKLPTPKASVVDTMDSQDFVVISSETKAKRILTDHQKEMACRRSLIPAMYADLSQDSSPLLSESLDCKDVQTSICTTDQRGSNETTYRSKPRMACQKLSMSSVGVSVDSDATHNIDAFMQKDCIEEMTHSFLISNGLPGSAAVSLKKPPDLVHLANTNCRLKPKAVVDENSNLRLERVPDCETVNFHVPIVDICSEEISQLNLVPTVLDVLSEKSCSNNSAKVDVDKSQDVVAETCLEVASSSTAEPKRLNENSTLDNNHCNAAATSEELLEEIGRPRFVEVEIESSSNTECLNTLKTMEEECNKDVILEKNEHEYVDDGSASLSEAKDSELSGNCSLLSLSVSTRSHSRKRKKRSVVKASKRAAKTSSMRFSPSQPHSAKKLSELDVVMLIKARRRSLSSTDCLSVEGSLSSRTRSQSSKVSTRSNSLVIPSAEKNVPQDDNTDNSVCTLTPRDLSNNDSDKGVIIACCESSVANHSDSPLHCEGNPVEWLYESVPFDTVSTRSNSTMVESLDGDCLTNPSPGSASESKSEFDLQASKTPDKECLSIPVRRRSCTSLSPNKCDTCLQPSGNHAIKRISPEFSSGVRSRAALILKLAQHTIAIDSPTQKERSMKDDSTPVSVNSDTCQFQSKKLSKTTGTSNEPCTSETVSCVMLGSNRLGIISSTSPAKGSLLESPLSVSSPRLQNGSPLCGSPSVSPSGILKKRKSDLELSSSTPNKRKVSFADPPVQGETCYSSRNQKPERDGSWNFCDSRIPPSPNRSTNPEYVSIEDSPMKLQENDSVDFAESNYESPLMTDLNSKTCICPELVDCKDPVDSVIHHLTTSTWSRGLGKLLHSRAIKTIGDLSALSETDVHFLPIKPPKGMVVRQALLQHWRSLQIEPSKVALEPSNAELLSAPTAEFGSLASCTSEKLDGDGGGAMPSLEDALAEFSPMKVTVKSNCVPRPSDDELSETSTGVVPGEPLSESTKEPSKEEARNCHPLWRLLEIIDSLERATPPDRDLVSSRQTLGMFASAFHRLGELCLKWTKEERC